jgi:hypothetical protein
MAQKLNVDIELFWIEEHTDCSECSGCRETIFSNMYKLIIIVNKHQFKESDLKLCSSCFSVSDFKLFK